MRITVYCTGGDRRFQGEAQVTQDGVPVVALKPGWAFARRGYRLENGVSSRVWVEVESSEHDDELLLIPLHQVDRMVLDVDEVHG